MIRSHQAPWGREIDAIDGKLIDANRTLGKQKDLVRRGFMTQYELSDSLQTVKFLSEQQTAKQKEYDENLAKIQRPSFPKAMTLVAMDDLTPPQVAANVVMAEDTQAVQLVAPPGARRGNSGAKPRTNGGEKSTLPKPEIKTEIPKVEESIISVNAQPAAHRKVRITSYAAAFPISENLILTAAAPLADAMEIELQAAEIGWRTAFVRQ